MFYFMSFMFFAIPIAAIIFFIVSLNLYRSAKKQNKENPGSISIEKIESRKDMLLGASLFMGGAVAVVIGNILITYLPISFM